MHLTDPNHLYYPEFSSNHKFESKKTHAIFALTLGKPNIWNSSTSQDLDTISYINAILSITISQIININGQEVQNPHNHTQIKIPKFGTYLDFNWWNDGK